MYISPKFLFDHLYFKNHDKINIKNSKERRGRGRKGYGIGFIIFRIILNAKTISRKSR
jgi:hypothetical protein